MNLPNFSAYRPARLLRARSAAREQTFIDVEPPPGFLNAHTLPGQFCRMRVAEADGIFAMFSRPGAAPRFLVRRGNPDGGEAADRLSELDDGAPIEMSNPAGHGFDLERARGRDLRFVATGTGVAPVCAAIERVLSERAAFGDISLDHGVRSEGHLAIALDIARWRDAGVCVRVVYSSVDEAGNLAGKTVQESLRENVTTLSGAAIIGVGQPEMLASLRALVVELGGHPDDLLTNV